MLRQTASEDFKSFTVLIFEEGKDDPIFIKHCIATDKDEATKTAERAFKKERGVINTDGYECKCEEISGPKTVH